VVESTIYVTKVIAERFVFDKLKDAVFARIFSRHERGPRLGREGVDRGIKFPPGALFHQFFQGRKLPFFGPRSDEPKGSAVQTDYR